MPRDNRRSRAVLGLLLLASFTVITLDSRSSGNSPVDPLRTAAGAALGPVQSAMSAAVRPVAGLPEYFADVQKLRAENAHLAARNAKLAAKLRTSGVDRQRLKQLDGLLRAARVRGRSLVPARVVGLGPAQSFAQTVTIDAGSQDGVGPDMTVLNADGLVGRVVKANARTATVLLIADPESVVGGRLGRGMELGFLRGTGGIGESARLQLSLVDEEVTPSVGDSVVTWGSRDGTPYVPGVPVGEVTAVQSNPAELSTTATVRPYVDFTALDLVGVVVDGGPRPPRRTLPDRTPYVLS